MALEGPVSVFSADMDTFPSLEFAESAAPHHNSSTPGDGDPGGRTCHPIAAADSIGRPASVWKNEQTKKPLLGIVIRRFRQTWNPGKATYHKWPRGWNIQPHPSTRFVLPFFCRAKAANQSFRAPGRTRGLSAVRARSSNRGTTKLELGWLSWASVEFPGAGGG